MNYDFSIQAKIFSIAYEILEDYDIEEWSFGGGTALSYCYYQHRMSYDIDIFSEDFGFIDKLIRNRVEIARNLGIPLEQVIASTTAITFILEEHGHGLKLDFLYLAPLTSSPYIYKDIFGFNQIKVQTPEEILARKLKYREIITVRDYVDFAFAQNRDNTLCKLKSEVIVDIDRYLDVLEQFNSFEKLIFDQELSYLQSSIYRDKKSLYDTINSIMMPPNVIQIAFVDDEVVAFDEFIDSYSKFYDDLGGLDIYEITKSSLSHILQKDDISYIDILRLDRDIVTKDKG